MKCKKCDNVATVTLRKKDSYCETCFLNGTNHKFRACLGKSKILSPNEKVLLCLSRGRSSTVLLDLVYNGVMMDSHKKLRIHPVCFHVIDKLDNCDATMKLIEKCLKYNIDLYVCHLSEYMQSDIKLPGVNTIPDKNDDLEKQLHSLLSSMSATISNDFRQKIKRNLFLSVAKLLACKSIMTGEYTNTLAINLLSGIALGRGAQLEDDVGFWDKRNVDVKIIRPMRDISKEELDNYARINQLNIIIADTDLNENSLHTTVSNYVNDLQENFHATISTVCKTAGKIGFRNQSSTGSKCVICEGNLNDEICKLTALYATNFSRGLSSGLPVEDQCNLMFPFINTHLCYSCSKNYLEMGNDNLPNYIKQKLN